MMLKALLVIPVATLAVSVFANGTNASETPKEPHPQKTTQTKIHDAVEEMPEFNGGQLAMMEFLMNNMKYPQAAVKAKQQGYRRICCQKRRNSKRRTHHKVSRSCRSWRRGYTRGEGYACMEARQAEGWAGKCEVLRADNFQA